MGTSIRRRRLSTYIFLFVPGLALASWVTRTPAVRDELGASTAGMGLLLFGVSIGSMSGVLSSARFVRRFGTRPVIAGGISLLLFGVALIALGAGIGQAALVFVGFLCFGFGIGAAEVAINIEGAEVERLTGAPVLVELHGSFSAGTLVGALIGIGLTATAFPVSLHLLAVVAVSIPVFVWAIRGIEPGFGRRPKPIVRTVEPGDPPPVSVGPDSESDGGKVEAEPVWKDGRLALIAIVLLAVALAEGSATDWLPLLMVDGYDLDESSGSIVFAAFAATMTVGRFGSRFVLNRFGRSAALRGGVIIGAIGVATVIFASNPVLAGFAVVLWGLGVSFGFPVAIAAASDSGPDSVARVGLAASAGYIAFLVGPPLLGFLGEHFGLRSAMLVVLGALAVAILLSPAVGPRPATPPAD